MHRVHGTRQGPERHACHVCIRSCWLVPLLSLSLSTHCPCSPPIHSRPASIFDSPSVLAPRVCFYFRNASISPQPMRHVSHSSLHSCCNDVSLILRQDLDGCSCYSTRSPESALHRMTASTPPPRGFGYTAVIKCGNMHHHKRGK